VRFHGYVCAEALAERCFSRADVACNDDSLRHSLWKTREVTEELHQQAAFFLSVRQTAGNVVYVQFCFVFEHALMEFHGLNLKPLV
jgi:hypothetical protein